MIKIVYKDQEYEYRGEYGAPRKGDYYLEDDPEILLTKAIRDFGVERAIVYPIPKTHKFGGVVFEEVGHRATLIGEWVLMYEAPRLMDYSSAFSQTILKPVGTYDVSDQQCE
jgi:hypothetical protein